MVILNLMKKRLKLKVVFLYTGGSDLCLRYRIENVAYALKKEGAIVKVYNIDKVNNANYFIKSANVVVIFRSLYTPQISDIIQKCRHYSIPIIFDIDDLIFDPRLISFFGHYTEELKESTYDWASNFKLTLEQCDYCTAPTQFLLDNMKKIIPHGFLIPNTINKKQYILAQELNKEKSYNNKIIKIGYFSGSKTHNKDFQEVANSLIGIMDKYGNAEFHLVGELELDKRFNAFGSRIIKKEFMPYLDMLRYLSYIDINIAPLEMNNPFTAAKSELKLFEAALVKTPSIVSATDTYKKCIFDEENAFLAYNNVDWNRCLSALIESPSKRKIMAERAYIDFTKMFYIENLSKNIFDNYMKVIV